MVRARDCEWYFILAILDRFSVRGSSGIHNCFTALPVRRTVADVENASDNEVHKPIPDS
jgi:hypothetical protein